MLLKHVLLNVIVIILLLELHSQSDITSDPEKPAVPEDTLFTAVCVTPLLICSKSRDLSF